MYNTMFERIVKVFFVIFFVGVSLTLCEGCAIIETTRVGCYYCYGDCDGISKEDEPEGE